MKLLIVSATFKEIEPTFNFFKIKKQSNKNFYKSDFLGNELCFFITGIGSYSTIYYLTKLLSNLKFDLIINIGIAGSYDKKIRIGDVVLVKSEQIGDLGIDHNGVFKTIFEEKFISPNKTPFKKAELLNPHTNLINKISNIKKVKALTVNTTTGDKNKIRVLKNKFNAQIETMEGAAFFYVCLQEKIKFLEIRAISNYVKPRNKEEWDVYLSISKLNERLKIIIFEILK